jgi:PIN domain nuclease of toxin-antitoxin system
MKILLDPHVFLWWVTDDTQLSSTARTLISDPKSHLLLSTASTWEIIIKVGTGKLTLPEAPELYIPSRLTLNKIESLPILLSHTLQVASLPDYHRDPFDRILIAQSQAENLLIMTADHQITKYPVNVIW